MDSVRLRVQTVPAIDPVSLIPHTAYLVLRDDSDGGFYYHAPGWTLRDAIDNYCEWFKIDRNLITILRPFIPQRFESYDY